MKNTTRKLLMSVAALALIAGAGTAYAQAPASATQQTAPAEKMAPAANDGTVKGKTPAARRAIGQVEDRMERKGMERKDGKAARTQDNTKGDTLRGTRSQSRSSGATNSDRSVDDKTRTQTKSGINPDGRTTQKSGNDNTSTRSKAAPPGARSLSSEQRTSIRTVINRQNAKPATNVNFAISVGTAVPRSVRFHRVPMELVQIYPSWRGYDYFLVGDQIIVVHPRTHKIVAVLDA